MKKIVFLFLILLTSTATWASDYSENPLVPKEELKIARGFTEQAVAKNYEGMKSFMVPQAEKTFTLELFDKINEHLPSGNVLSTSLIGFHIKANGAGEKSKEFIFEFEYDSFWLVVRTKLIEVKENEFKVSWFDFTQFSQSQEEINKFTLGGQSLLHYLVFISAIIIPLYILFTLVVCIRTKFNGRKWPWVIFIIGGIGVMHFNWSSGAYLIKLLHYQLLGSGFTHPPTIFSIGFPLGAILFWLKKKNLEVIDQSKQEIIL